MLWSCPRTRHPIGKAPFNWVRLCETTTVSRWKTSIMSILIHNTVKHLPKMVLWIYDQHNKCRPLKTVTVICKNIFNVILLKYLPYMILWSPYLYICRFAKCCSTCNYTARVFFCYSTKIYFWELVHHFLYLLSSAGRHLLGGDFLQLPKSRAVKIYCAPVNFDW